MPTPYRGYSELPGSAVPDVPYRVNLALREIDADVDSLATTVGRLDGPALAAAVSKAASDADGAKKSAAAAAASAATATGPSATAVTAEMQPGRPARGVVDAAIKAETAKVIPANVSLYGKFSSRPAVSAVAVGATYYAWDTQESYRADGNGGGWVTVGAGGTNLATAKSTVYFPTPTANTFADIPGLIATFVAGTRPVEIEVNMDWASSTAGGTLTAEVLLGTKVVQEITDVHAAADKWASVSKTVTVPASELVPGTTYTAKVRVKATAIARVDGGVTKPAQLTVSGR